MGGAHFYGGQVMSDDASNGANNGVNFELSTDIADAIKNDVEQRDDDLEYCLQVCGKKYTTAYHYLKINGKIYLKSVTMTCNEDITKRTGPPDLGWFCHLIKTQEKQGQEQETP